jgi:hypothetical protein
MYRKAGMARASDAADRTLCDSMTAKLKGMGSQKKNAISTVLVRLKAASHVLLCGVQKKNRSGKGGTSRYKN